jgi:hypothetical protein
MNNTLLLGSWHDKKVNIRNNYNNTTDLDSMFEEGTKEEIIRKRRIKFGKTIGDKNIN